MNSAKRTILIIIELKQREFVSKVLLAKIFAEAGWRVILGTINSVPIYAKRLPPSVILHKGLLKETASSQKMGHKIAVLDEEGGVVVPDSEIRAFCLARYPQIAVETPDLYLAANESFAKQVGQLPGTGNVKIVATGWPRLDTWFHSIPRFYQDKARLLESEYGNFVLYVSSFGIPNDRKLEKLSKRSSQKAWADNRSRRSKAFREQVLFIQKLGAALAPKMKLIVRPHIVESERAWGMLLSDQRNVLIDKSGDITPWILASKGVIVFFSTTGIQSSLMGRPTIQYKPDYVKGQEASLALTLPSVVDTPENAIETLSRKNIQPKEQVLAYLRAGGWIDPAEPASLKILREIEKFEVGKYSPIRASRILRSYLFIRHFFSFLKFSAYKFGLFRGSPLKGNDRSVFANMPGGMSSEEISTTLAGFAQNEEESFEIQKLGTHLFSIEMNEGG